MSAMKSAQEASEKFLFKMMSLFVSSPTLSLNAAPHSFVGPHQSTRSLQEFSQRPSADGRCTSTSFVGAVGNSVCSVWLFQLEEFVKTTQCTLMPRLPPIDVDSEQADLPEVLVAIQLLDKIHQMLMDDDGC